MKQSIAGVAPAELTEVTSMTVWPSIGATAPGRLVGRLASNPTGFGIFTIGNFLAVATIPISLVAYAWRLLPFVATRYTITNQRIVVQKGLQPSIARSLGLAEFDRIDVEIQGGQEWLHAGDLVFRRDGSEVFRLPGVSRPYPFREACRKAHLALVSVREATLAQTATGP